MRKLIAALVVLLGLTSAASAQRVQAPGVVAIACAFSTVEPTLTSGWFGYAQCNNKGELIIAGGGGGGGGLSVQDQAAFTQGSSNFTPGGGVYNDAATLASGTQGTYRLTTKRAQIVDTDTTGNALYAAITAPLPAQSTHTVNIGAVDLISQYPAGATAITASATGTTAATTATLAGTGGKTTYICGYSIRANATAAVTVTNTITGVITATLSSIMWVAPLASGIGVDEQIFSPCIPASGTNQAIAIVSGAPGSGGTVSSKGWGYQQ